MLNEKQIIITHFCFGYKKQCLLYDTIKRILEKDYPEDKIELKILKINK